MSLKSKIEAVIYASEEPVTLAQLTGLLGEEGQAELDVLAANQPSLGLDLGDDDLAAPPTEPDPDEDALNAEVLDSTEATALETPAESSESSTDLSSRPESALSADEAERPASEPAPSSPAEPNAKLLAAEQKLAARKLRDYFRSLLDQLIADYANSDRGLEIVEVAGGYRLRTKPEYHDAVRGFIKSLKPPLKLTLQALETLAVIAYKQPVTAPEITEIRGVDSAGTIGSLITRKLVTTAGRKQVIGRPMLYKTTKDFLLRFGLKDIAELPSIEEFEKMAGELNDAIQEEIPMEEQEATPSDSQEDFSSRPESSPSHREDAAERPASEPGDDPSMADAPAASQSLNEAAAVPEPTHILHDTPEDLASDHSTHPEGVKHEPEA
jgi:segregation and condensation protein B